MQLNVSTCENKSPIYVSNLRYNITVFEKRIEK